MIDKESKRLEEPRRDTHASVSPLPDVNLADNHHETLPSGDAAPPFLRGGGEMGERIRAHDWAQTALGPAERWPQELQTLVGVLLRSPAPLAIGWGPELILLYNDAYGELLGLQQDGALGQPGRVVFAERWAMLEPLFAQALSGSPVEVRDQHAPLRRDGRVSDTWFHLNFTPIVCADGSVGGILSQPVETTERMRDEMRAMERLLPTERLLNSLSDGVFMLDRAWRFTYANPRSLAITRKSREELIGVTLWKAFPELVGAEAERQHRYAMQQRVPVVFEQQFAPSGLWLEYRLNPLADGLLVILSDITARKQADQALRESEQRFRVALQGSTTTVFTQDRDLRFTWIYNPAPGFTAEGILGKTNEDLLPPEEGREVMAIKRNVLETGVGWRGELATHNPRGEQQFFDCFYEPLRDGGRAIVGLIGTSTNITARKQTEQALRETEQKYRELVEHAPAGIYEMDFRTQRFASVNDVICQILGYSREELLAMDPFSLLDEESRQRFADRIARALRGEPPPSNVEYTITTRDGRTIIADLAVTFAADEQGRLCGATVVAHDITERKRQEQALQESEQRFREVLDHSRDMIVRYNLQTGRYEYVSASAEAVTGDSVEEHLAQDPEVALQMVHPDDVVMVRTARERALATGTAEVEYRRRCKDGAYRWLSNRLAVVRDTAGRPAYRIANIRDITARKQAEQALRESEAKYRTIVETAGEGVVIARPDGPYFFVNQRMVDMLGYTRDEILGKSSVDFTDDDWKPQVFQARQDLGAGNRIQGEFKFRRKDGSALWTMYNATPMHNDKGEHVATLCMHSDITARKQAEEALAAERARLRATLDALPIGVFIADSTGRFIETNEQVQAIWGQPPHPIESRAEYQEYKGWWPDTGERLTSEDWAMARALTTGEVTIGEEINIQRFDGSLGTILNNAAPIRDAQGRITGAVVVVQDITDRKQDEQLLAADLHDTLLLRDLSAELISEGDIERLYEEILDAASAITRSDFASMQLLHPERGNGGALELLAFRGFTPEAARFWEWVYPEADSTCGRALRTGRRVIASDVETAAWMAGTGDQAMYRQTGIRAVQTTPLYARSGKLVGMLSTHWSYRHEPSARELRFLDLLARQAADLIARSQAEKALAAERARLRAILDALPVAVWIADANGRILETNDQAAAIWGESAPRSESWEEYQEWKGWWPDTGEQLRAEDWATSRALTKGEVVIGEQVNIQRFDGGFRTVLNSAAPVRDAEGRIIGAITVEQDITSIRQTEEELRALKDRLEERVAERTAALQASEERFRVALQGSPITVFGQDRDLRYTWAYNAAPGFRAEDFIGKTDEEMFAPEDAAALTALKRHVLTTGLRRRVEVVTHRAPSAGGEMVHDMAVEPLRDATEAIVGIVAAAHDITERKKAEEMLIEMERLTAIGRMAATLSHELNNPLQSVIGCLGLAQEALGPSEDANRYMTIALRELKRAANLVRRMRDLSRPDRDTRQPTDISELIEHTVTLTQKQAQERQVQLLWEADSELPLLLTMRERIQQVLLNLVLNALDAMPDGGELRIRATGTGVPAGVQITLSDTGIGMSPEQLAHLFEAFHTTKSQGMGLGLYVSRSILEEHGGSIAVQSEEGVGTTFTLWLPAAPPAEQVAGGEPS